MLQKIACWSDGTPLIDDGGWTQNLNKEPIRNLNGPRLAAKADPGKRLNADDLADDFAFNDLYYTWLGFSSIMWRMHERGLQYKAADALDRMADDFRYYDLSRATDAEREEYLDGKIGGVFLALNNDRDRFFARKAAVRDQMRGIPLYLQTRVIAACALMDRMPQDLFSQGQGWPEAFARFLPRRADDIRVEDGQTLRLDLASPLPEPLRLRAGTLFNDSDRPVALSVLWNDRAFPLRLPPWGKLRALFAGEGGGRLLGIKGNIAFNADGKIATVQRFDKTGLTTVTLVTRGKRCDTRIEGALDAFPLSTGFGVLLSNSVLDNNRRPVDGAREDGRLPVRCYSAGESWARLYEDGTLIYGDQGGPRGRCGALGAVETGGFALYFLTAGGGLCSWANGTLNDMGSGKDALFVSYMMERFLVDDRCEWAANDSMALGIDLQGRLL